MPGDRVMVWGENCAEWVVAFFACLLRGAVVVPMDEVASADFAGRVAGQVGVRMLFRSRNLALDLPDVPQVELDDL